MDRIREINNKEAWERFLAAAEEKTFLQSWNWGEFNMLSGNKIWRLGIFIDEELSAVALVVEIVAKRGAFLFVPHGPVLLRPCGLRIDTVTEPEPKTQNGKILNLLLEKLKEIAKIEKVDFIRISPIWRKTDESAKIFKNLGFRDAPTHMHPELSWELDIKPAEGELLMAMRKTTRYLIRQAEKNKEIEVIKSRDINSLEVFNRLYQETVDRHHFVPFSREYLKNEFSTFNGNNQVLIFLGKYKNEVASSAMIIFWSGIGFYHQGASSLKYAKVPVSYLLQWEAIKEAKRRGCNLYSFWGISPIEDRKHPWFGLSKFKMGFGGYQKEYVKTKDFPLSKKYWLIYLFEKLRRIKRGL